MNRACLDPRVWLPLALAAAALLVRETTWQHVLDATPHSEAIELPIPRLVAGPQHDQSYDLDAAHSSVRFLVGSEGRELLVRCPVVQGRLDLRADPAASVLELRLDLASLVPVVPGEGGEPEAGLRHLLGIRRGEEIIYRATLVSTSTAPVPGLLHRLWQGSLRFGGRIVRQPMGLWQTALPGQPLRLQGYGTVGTDAYGLPRRSWLGLVEEHHVVTLGLDLAWKRRAAH